MNKNIILGIVVILVLVGGIYYLSKDKQVVQENLDGDSAAGTIENIGDSEVGSVIKMSVLAKSPKEEADIKVISIEEKEWPDACLGKADDGEMCAQVITPGYELKVNVSGEVRTYRTNLDASVIRRD
jgi:hypothetical protein